MTGLNSIMANIDGKVNKAVHRFQGFKATYTLLTDETTDPNTESVLTVFMGTTDTKWIFDPTVGRKVEVTEDIFFISREFLRVGGVFFEPRALKDSFVEFGTTTPVFHIESVRDMAHAAGTYELTCKAVRSEFAGG